MKHYHTYMDNFSVSVALYKNLMPLLEKGVWEQYTRTDNAQDKTSTGHNGTKLRSKMNNQDAYNKKVIQKCLRTSLKEVVMSMMFTKTVWFLTVTNVYHKLHNTTV